MGRYAFFNTGLEYKFVFALQESQDILRFGGWFNNSWTENPTVKWSATEDSPSILEKLRHMEHTLGLPECDFNAYSADIDGTHKLRDTLDNHNTLARYVLGCLIYHQLLYTPVLRAHFEF